MIEAVLKIEENRIYLLTESIFNMIFLDTVSILFHQMSNLRLRRGQKIIFVGSC